jgi:hypothetical protein
MTGSPTTGSLTTGSLTNTEALDQCRQAVAAEAGHLGGAGDTFSAGGCPSSVFGRLAAAAAMAGAVDAVGSRMRSELDAAERLLRDVERAIGAVEKSVRDVDDESARGLTATEV